MARTQARPRASRQVTLQPHQTTCRACGSQMRMGHHSHRTVTTLQGVTRLTLKVYRCRNKECLRFHQPTRPEEEGRWALPHGEFGLDVIALVGTLRYQQQRSVPQIHEELLRRGLQVAQRTVTDQLYRYEELVALHLADAQRLKVRLSEQKQVILALDGLQPDVGHEVLWVLRDCCSGIWLQSHDASASMGRSFWEGSRVDKCADGRWTHLEVLCNGGNTFALSVEFHHLFIPRLTPQASQPSKQRSRSCCAFSCTEHEPRPQRPFDAA